MALLFPDKRKAITGQFFINDSRIRHNSRRAFKKIRSWKESSQTVVDTDARYHEQFENLVRLSFFNTVSPNFILSKEKFYDRPLMN